MNPTFTAQRTKPQDKFAHQDLGIPRLFLPFWNLMSSLICPMTVQVGTLHQRISGFQGNLMTSPSAQPLWTYNL